MRAGEAASLGRQFPCPLSVLTSPALLRAVFVTGPHCLIPVVCSTVRACRGVCVKLLYGGVTDNGAQNDVWATTNGRQWIWVAGYSDGIPHPYNNERYAETFPAWYEAANCQVTTLQHATLTHVLLGTRSATETTPD